MPCGPHPRPSCERLRLREGACLSYQTSGALIVPSGRDAPNLVDVGRSHGARCFLFGAGGLPAPDVRRCERKRVRGSPCAAGESVAQFAYMRSIALDSPMSESCRRRTRPATARSETAANLCNRARPPDRQASRSAAGDATRSSSPRSCPDHMCRWGSGSRATAPHRHRTLRRPDQSTSRKGESIPRSTRPFLPSHTNMTDRRILPDTEARGGWSTALLSSRSLARYSARPVRQSSQVFVITSPARGTRSVIGAGPGSAARATGLTRRRLAFVELGERDARVVRCDADLFSARTTLSAIARTRREILDLDRWASRHALRSCSQPT